MKKRRLIIIAIAAILAAILVLTAAAVPLIRKNKAVRIAKSLPPYILEAVLAYNDLISPGELTLEMFEEVTSLRFMYDKAVIVSVNGSKFGTNLGPYILPNRMENLYLTRIPDGVMHNKFEAFYWHSTDTYPENKERRAAVVSAVHPELIDRPAYFFDTTSSEREKEILSTYVTEYVFTGDELMTDRVLDLSSLASLPNLESVEYFIDTDIVRRWNDEDAYMEECGLTFENCPVEIIVTKEPIVDRELEREISDSFLYQFQ